MKKFIFTLIILSISIILVSCAGSVKQQRGTDVGSVVGAGIGAILGQAIGGDTEATLLGAGIGAVLGGIAGKQVGAYMDMQERELREALAASEAASVQRVKEARALSEAAIAQRMAAAEQRGMDILTATFRSELLFDYDSAILKPGAYREIARVATVLNKYAQTTIRVEGHTDLKGSEGYNQKLSERRAKAVMDALIQQGVDDSRIEAVGYGETQPISSDDAMNRRVTIVIKPAVTGPLLNVRSGPEKIFPVIFQVHEGEPLVVYGYAPDWLYVKYQDNAFGWVMLKYTSFLSSASG